EGVRYATEDAKAFGEALAAWGAGSQHGISLADDHASAQAVRDQIAKHLARAREGDNVVFYFAGYGTRNKNGEATLVFHDSNGTSDQVTLRELVGLLAPIKGSKLVLLDTAFDGQGRSVKG